jgi:hypothetical protein
MELYVGYRHVEADVTGDQNGNAASAEDFDIVHAVPVSSSKTFG